jgi:hypothetical protein
MKIHQTATKISTGWLLAAAAVVLLAAVHAGDAAATKAIAEAEGGLTCTVCHDKPGSKLYTDEGKYYEAMGTLDGYDEVIDAFSACTTCHVRKPGSEKLTRQGREFSRVIRDMEELKEWVLSEHPPVVEEKGSEEDATDGDGGS